jgi:hypothetical protein
MGGANDKKEDTPTKLNIGPKVIITDSLSTMMAVSDRKRTKNPKTQTIRKLMDQQREKITLLWVPGPKKP